MTKSSVIISDTRGNINISTYNNDIILMCTVEGREEHFSYAEFFMERQVNFAFIDKASGTNLNSRLEQ